MQDNTFLMKHMQGNTFLVKHMQGNTFLVCAAPFHIWKIKRASESTLGQSDLCPFASQGSLCLWLALHGFVVRRLKASKARAWIDAYHDSFAALFFFFFYSLHTKLFPVFKHDEAIPLKQNNETKRCTFENWFAHKEMVNWEDDGNDEGIDFVSYFRILSLEIATFVSRHSVLMLRSAGKQPYDDILVWGQGFGVN